MVTFEIEEQRIYSDFPRRLYGPCDYYGDPEPIAKDFFERQGFKVLKGHDVCGYFSGNYEKGANWNEAYENIIIAELSRHSRVFEGGEWKLVPFRNESLIEKLRWIKNTAPSIVSPKKLDLIYKVTLESFGGEPDFFVYSDVFDIPHENGEVGKEWFFCEVKKNDYLKPTQKRWIVEFMRRDLGRVMVLRIVSDKNKAHRTKTLRLNYEKIVESHSAFINNRHIYL